MNARMSKESYILQTVALCIESFLVLPYEYLVFELIFNFSKAVAGKASAYYFRSRCLAFVAGLTLLSF